MLRKLLALAALFAGVVAVVAGPAPTPPPAGGVFTWTVPERGFQTAYVLEVHDGDTLTAGLLVPVTIRLNGINAPELKAVGGAASRDALIGQVKGKLVTLDLDGREKYGRTLGRVWLGQTDVCAWMIDNKHAVAWDGKGPKP